MDDKLLEELKEQTKWLRLLAFPTLKKAIEENIATKEQKRIYDLSDGKNSTYEIAKKLKSEGIKISHMTVHNYWKKWFPLGIVAPSEEYSGRLKKIIDLKEAGIVSPSYKRPRNKKEPEEKK